MAKKHLRDLRCPDCNKLIIKQDIKEGFVEYWCGRCKKMFCFNFETISTIKDKSDMIKLEQRPSQSSCKIKREERA